MALKSSNKVDTNVYEIEVTVTPDVFTDACKSAYMKQRKSIQLPGFRKGKATQGMIEKVYGENAFYEEDQVNEYDLTIFVKEEEGLYRKYQETHFEKAWTLEKVKELLEEAGMEFLGVYDGFTKEAPKEDSERILVAACEKGK